LLSGSVTNNVEYDIYFKKKKKTKKNKKQTPSRPLESAVGFAKELVSRDNSNEQITCLK